VTFLNNVKATLSSATLCALLFGFAPSLLAERGTTATGRPAAANPVASGVVLASFSQSDNAERFLGKLAPEMLKSGVRLTVLEGARAGSDAIYRVVAQREDQASRDLLAQLRSTGFSDAWHISSALLAPAAKEPQQPAEPEMLADANAPIAEVSDAVQGRAPAIVAKPSDTPLVAQPDGFAGPGEQTVFDTEAGVDLHQLKIQTLDHAAADITVDGRIEEATWRSIPYYDNMGVSIPDLGTKAEYATKIRLFATEKGLFVSADMEQPPETLVERLTRRDDWVDRDLFGVTIDASGEAKLGYWFYVALGNSLNDGKVLPERRFQRDWDGPWTAKAARTTTGWSAEMYLPWSMMDMPQRDGLRNMGFVASRMVSHRNQRYQWPWVWGNHQALCLGV
jgi:hypothetical protein